MVETIVCFKDLQPGNLFRFPGSNLSWLDSHEYQKIDLFINRFGERFNAQWSPGLEISMRCGMYLRKIKPNTKVIRV